MNRLGPTTVSEVAVALQPSVYQGRNVKAVALETWRPDPDSAPVTGGKEGVIRFATAAGAEALFVEFSRQRCEGKTASVPTVSQVLSLRSGCGENGQICCTTRCFTPTRTRTTSDGTWVIEGGLGAAGLHLLGGIFVRGLAVLLANVRFDAEAFGHVGVMEFEGWAFGADSG
ncbi:sensor domain-containing protein [Mycobacterium colombiense]|uniref:sensor domain-containing protein n=1 Tax=Mycobacterium colombiense TaxID=339268 RepID=UPI0009BED8EF